MRNEWTEWTERAGQRTQRKIFDSLEPGCHKFTSKWIRPDWSSCWLLFVWMVCRFRVEVSRQKRLRAQVEQKEPAKEDSDEEEEKYVKEDEDVTVRVMKEGGGIPKDETHSKLHLLEEPKK